MQAHTIELTPGSPGQRYALQVLRFGAPDASPKAYVQAAVHADELPAILVAHQLKQMLAALEARGELLGQVVLVPFANPIGLSQQVHGQLHGRFDLRDGVNFNREYADLAPLVAAQLAGKLGADAKANTRLIREALRQVTATLPATTPTQDLKNHLLRLAVDADMVLDLHCDTAAALHVYALSPQADLARQLGALLGARAILIASESGGTPFDEACSRTWLQLQQQFAQFPIELGCFSTTVELRGETDLRHELARQDAQALLDFMRLHGVLCGPLPVVPVASCEPTPLAASEPITASKAGVVVFRSDLGQRVAAGDVIADLVDAETGDVTPMRCESAGVLYARTNLCWAYPGKVLAKIAGTALARTGKLLGP
jgi:hypothetical protein